MNITYSLPFYFRPADFRLENHRDCFAPPLPLRCTSPTRWSSSRSAVWCWRSPLSPSGGSTCRQWRRWCGFPGRYSEPTVRWSTSTRSWCAARYWWSCEGRVRPWSSWLRREIGKSSSAQPGVGNHDLRALSAWLVGKLQNVSDVCIVIFLLDIHLRFLFVRKIFWCVKNSWLETGISSEEIMCRLCNSDLLKGLGRPATNWISFIKVRNEILRMFFGIPFSRTRNRYLWTSCEWNVPGETNHFSSLKGEFGKIWKWKIYIF